MKKFRYMRQRFSQKLELPEDSLGNVLRLQIIGNCAILCNCKKILKYKSEEISVLTKHNVVTFKGEHLKCIYFFEGNIEICGDFCNVEFENK